MRRRLQEEEISGEENASGVSPTLEKGSARSVSGERLQEEDATGGRSKRMKLQKVETPGIEDSMRWGLYEEALGGEGSMSGEFQADLPPGGSMRWRHLKEEVTGKEYFKRRRRLLDNCVTGKDFMRRLQ